MGNLLKPEDLGSDVNVLVTSFLEQFAKRVASEVIDYFNGQNETDEVAYEVISNEEDELLKIAQVCKILKVSRVTLNNWQKNGYLVPDSQIGRSPRYKRSTIESFIQNS